MDVLSDFVKLSIRKGSSLEDLSKEENNLKTVLLAFLATSENKSKPDRTAAQSFLQGPGSWIEDTPEQLLSMAESVSDPCCVPSIDLKILANEVSSYRNRIKENRRRIALFREEEIRKLRINTSLDPFFMEEAIREAQIAETEGEVPVGAVLVDKKGNIIGRGHNRVISKNDPTAHAEIMAIRDAANHLNNYRLEDCALYVTLEPCPMCAGAILNSRLSRLVYGAKDPKAGAVESLFKLLTEKKLNHRPDVTSGVLENNCSELLRNFFAGKRKLRKTHV